MKVEYINPFIESTYDVFSTMLGCEAVRGDVGVAKPEANPRDIMGLIGLSGMARGIVALSFPVETAPNMPGIDAVRAIRANGKKMPIIMVTTEAEKSRVIAALKAGAQNYVIKPFEPNTIVGKIRDVLAKAAG